MLSNARLYLRVGVGGGGWGGDFQKGPMTVPLHIIFFLSKMGDLQNMRLCDPLMNHHCWKFTILAMSAVYRSWHLYRILLPGLYLKRLNAKNRYTPVADPRGAQQARPLKLDKLCFFSFHFLKSECLKVRLRMHEEKSIKTTVVLPGPLSGPRTPAESEIVSALVICVLAHNLLRPPLMKIPDPPLYANFKVAKVSPSSNRAKIKHFQYLTRHILNNYIFLKS